jgi:hypothetical protein
MSAFNAKGFAHNQGIGDDSPRLGQNTSEGRSGDIHHPGGRYLVQTLMVTQSDGFETFKGKHHLFRSPGGHSVGYKGIHYGSSLDESELSGSWHVILLL